MTKSVVFTTNDGVEIHGLYRNTGEKKIVILLHMMPATKESWNAVATQLLKTGYASLAIDLRGHGESTMNGQLDYKQFSDEEHQASQADVEGAIVFAKEHGFSESQILLIGASIGANLAIETLHKHPLIRLAIALSPGLDFHGIKTEHVMKELQTTQKILLIASDDDKYSFDSLTRLHEQNLSQTIAIELSDLGHGTRMTDTDPELIQKFFSFLET